MNKIFDYNNHTEWMNHLRISILIAREKYSRGVNLNTLGLGQILETLCYPKRDQKGMLLFKNKENDYKKDLHQIFSEALEPYVIEANLLVLLSTSYWKNSSPINDVDAKTILYNYFEKYCNEHTSITKELMTLHSSIMIYQDSPQFLKAINAMFVDYFRLHLEACGLNAFIRTDSFSNKFTLNTEWISTFFNSIPEFVDYIEKAENLDRKSDCFREFKNFIESWKKVGGGLVEFMFKSLQVS